jgi:hypothetical protein
MINLMILFVNTGTFLYKLGYIFYALTWTKLKVHLLWDMVSIKSTLSFKYSLHHFKYSVS